MPRMIIGAGKSIASLAIAVAALVVAGAVLGGGPPVSAAPAAAPASAANAHTAGDARLAPLHEFEETLRRQTDFRALPTGDAVTGPDPYVVRALPASAPASPGAQRLVSILRGAAQVVLLDADLHVTSRAATPRAPTGLVVADNGDIFVSSELTPVIARYRVTPAGLQPTGTLTLAGDGVRAVRDLAAGSGDGILYAADEIGGRLLTLRLSSKDPQNPHLAAPLIATAVGHGPIRVARAGGLVLVDSLLDHTVVAFRIGKEGAPAEEVARVRHDGPIWSFDAVTPDADHALLLVGGVEDHPLDRTGGSFGYIDSFLTVYRLSTRTPAPAPPVRLALTNLSALGVVTPKVVSARVDRDGSVRALVTGYGTSPLLTLTFPPTFQAEPSVAAQDLVPGTTSMVTRADGTLVFADPLLDAWVSHSPGAVTRVVSARDAPATNPTPSDEQAEQAEKTEVRARVGEALLFTTLMAPWNRSDGPLSRFTCETCHFEMYGDGRTHHTGRGDVHATTKPLRGLFNNRPHFSRALDPDLTVVANSEFRVAGAKSDHDPWFTVRVDDFPWLRLLGVTDPSLPPLALRKALMTALMRLGHAPNPAVTPGGHFTDGERQGAALFRDRCETCHQARLASDDPTSRLPFAQWESLVMTEPDPLVWGQAEYRQTGVVPYVHESGARVPSLRRLYKKFPYFTNGSAPDLGDLLTRARFAGDTFWHDKAPTGPTKSRLGPQEIQCLRAFLDLL